MTDANRYGLMLNFHWATLPRGWERMYPNHMTSEAVTASENLIFIQEFADKEAFNSTVFPLTHNAVASMDYGPVLLNKVFSRDHKQSKIRRTTDAGKESRDMTISLSWLKGKKLELLYDKEVNTVGQKEITVNDDGTAKVSLLPSGGAVLVFYP